MKYARLVDEAQMYLLFNYRKIRDWSTSNINCLDRRDKRNSQLLVDHEGQDSHHGGTSVVELDGSLLQLGVLIEGVPSVVKGSVAEVTREFGFSGNILHDGKLQKTDQGNNLANTGSSNVVEGGESVADTTEGKSLVVDISRETDPGFSDKVSEDGKHGDTSVLKFDVSKTGELFFVTIGNKSKRIEESKRRLGTELRLESLEGGGGSLLLGRGKGGSRGDKGGKNSGLHFYGYFIWIVRSADKENLELPSARISCCVRNAPDGNHTESERIEEKKLLIGLSPYWIQNFLDALRS